MHNHLRSRPKCSSLTRRLHSSLMLIGWRPRPFYMTCLHPKVAISSGVIALQSQSPKSEVGQRKLLRNPLHWQLLHYLVKAPRQPVAACYAATHAHACNKIARCKSWKVRYIKHTTGYKQLNSLVWWFGIIYCRLVDARQCRQAWLHQLHVCSRLYQYKGEMYDVRILDKQCMHNIAVVILKSVHCRNCRTQTRTSVQSFDSPHCWPVCYKNATILLID